MLNKILKQQVILVCSLLIIELLQQIEFKCVVICWSSTNKDVSNNHTIVFLYSLNSKLNGKNVIKLININIYHA